MTTLSDFRFSHRQRQVLRGIVAVCCPRQVEDLDLVDLTLAELELQVRSLPRVLCFGLMSGLTAYDLLAVFATGSGFRTAARLDREAAERYFLWWYEGPIGLFREFGINLKKLVTLCYYELPQVKRVLGYDPERWIERVTKRRFEDYGDEIREQERLVTEPDPLPGIEQTSSRRRAVPEIYLPGDPDSSPSTSNLLPEGLYNRTDFEGHTDLDCEVVIVGSGAGGSSMAAELAEAGVDVIVLEEGGYTPTEDFNTNASAMVRKLYRDGGATMAFGTPPIFFQEGRTVGGSMVVNGGMAWRTPERILEGWAAKDRIEAIDPKSMEPYFERVERRIHVATQDPESIGRDNELLKLGADRKQWKTIDNRRNQVHCAGSNNCAFGCPTRAKRSPLITYIPRALSFGARIYSDVKVNRILREGTRAVGVEGRVVQSNGRPGRRVRVRARMVVSACGAIQTPALLSRSGFRSASGMLGGQLTLHPNSKVVAFFDEEVRGWEGVHQAYQVRQFREEGFLMAAVNIPPGVVAMGVPEHGEHLGNLMKQYSHNVTAGILVEDTSVGRVYTGPGGMPITVYQVSDRDVEQLKRGTALLCELLFEAGAKRIHLPFGGVGELHGPDEVRKIFNTPIPKRSIEIVTVHLMGSARMGADPSQSVTNGFGQFHGAQGLVVSDASLFPGPIGVNPAETILALATRNAHHILENRASFLR